MQSIYMYDCDIKGGGWAVGDTMLDTGDSRRAGDRILDSRALLAVRAHRLQDVYLECPPDVKNSAAYDVLHNTMWPRKALMAGGG